ncbi:MAG: hypothetical protein ABIV39_02095 [Verrucomicrobiota bacterium]
MGLIFANAASASDPRLKKVLPQLIDTKERSSLSPSLYERDAYQAFLRAHSGERGGIRFAVLWHGSSKGKDLRLRVEMRGLRNEATLIKTLEVPVAKAGWFNTWTYLDLRGQEYKNFGELAAWRVTLWDGTRQLSEQKSFLW